MANVQIERARVSSTVNETRGSLKGSEIVEPSALPECDVLELDCEGAELEILEGLDIQPSTIIVETHANYDVSESEIEQLLEEIGYVVVDRGIESEEDGIYVLTAKLRPSGTD